jgi:6-phosphofructokinase
LLSYAEEDLLPVSTALSAPQLSKQKNQAGMYGVYDGFSGLAKGEKNVVLLTIEMVSRIHSDGGSVIRTSRYNPTKKRKTSAEWSMR